MQFSQKSRDNIEACRFCWMCHHICPIGNASGQERNGARARALGLSLVAREAIEYTDDVVNNVYECALCGGCVTDCITGLDPVLFTKEARKIAALEDRLPEYINKMLDVYEGCGNIYGEEKSAELVAKIKSLKAADTLFFIGMDGTYKTPCKAIKAIELMEKIGNPFTVLENEPDSGYAMNFMVGAVEETTEIAKNAAKALADYKTVVCYDSNDAAMFLREYKEWGIEVAPKVVTFTAYIAENLAKLNIKKSNKAYTIQDPATLVRDIEETEELRKIVEAIGENREMLLNRKETMLAGNLIMNEYMPEIIEKVAENRWANAINMNAETVITASPAEYALLKAVKPENVELVTVEEAVLACL